MTILSHWLNALKVGMPPQVKVMMLITVKAVRDAFMVFVRVWWWALILIVVGDLVLAPYIVLRPIPSHRTMAVWWLYGYYSVKMLLIWGMVLSNRSSIERKDVSYFWQYTYRFLIPVVLGVLAIIAGAVMIIAGVHTGVGVSYPSIMKYSAIPCWIPYLMLVWALCLLDDRGHRGGRSLIRAVRMMFYNLPVVAALVFIGTVGMRIAIYGVVFCCSSWQLPYYLIVTDAVQFMVSMTIIALCTTWYLKNVYEQYRLYFSYETNK